MDTLDFFIEHEMYEACPPLDATRFVDFCKQRGIRIDLEQLQRLEKAGLFTPFAKTKLPTYQEKIKRDQNTKTTTSYGPYRQGESWDGELETRSASFAWYKPLLQEWKEKGFFADSFDCAEGDAKEDISFYSRFQIYELCKLQSSYCRSIDLLEISQRPRKDKIRGLEMWIDCFLPSTRNMQCFQIALLCQFISTRYFHMTQTDQRWVTHSYQSGRLFDAYSYAQRWNPGNIISFLGLSKSDIKKFHEQVAHSAESIDPVFSIHELISFMKPRDREKFKGPALLAWTLHEMGHMLRKFYYDLTNEKLLKPHEHPRYGDEDEYGKEICDDHLLHLEYVVNKYGLNPRPKMIVCVEGDGEYNEIPRMIKELFGHNVSRLGIEMLNLKGIGGFTGKNRDRLGALEKFIDDHHSRGTLVFLIVDNEQGAEIKKGNMVDAQSTKANRKRKLIKNEHICIWKHCIEFDNFSPGEIAAALNKQADQPVFSVNEVRTVIINNKSVTKKGNPLRKLFEERTQNRFSKTKLLEDLVGNIIESKEPVEFLKNKYPLVKIVEDIIRLAAGSTFPVNTRHRQRIQRSGYFGEAIDNNSC